MLDTIIASPAFGIASHALFAGGIVAYIALRIYEETHRK